MSIGKAVIRPIKDALDDLPRHTGSLRGLGKSHRKKNRDNKDGVKNVDKFTEKPRHVRVSVKEFKRNKKHDATEFKRQHDEQMDQLHKISLAEWIENRKNYKDRGRTSDSLKAQQAARDAAFRDKYDALRDSGLSKDDANKAAKEWMTTQAATHRLDGIAGGNVTDISGVGDTRINSSLGSQWRTRIGDIQKVVDQFVKDNPGVDLSNVFLDVTFR